MVGAAKRTELVARDIVEHFERRLEAMDGKAMVVCMSRSICVALYRELVKLRPAWADETDARSAMKVVMTGSASDPPVWQAHIRNKPRREALAKRFRDPNDPFKLVIVRNMWLTGFDAPSLHSMKDRCVRAVRELSQAFALAVPHEGGLKIRDDVAFFQAVQSVLAKRAPGEARPEEELDQAGARSSPPRSRPKAW